MFFNRGERSSTALFNDLIVDDAHITMRLRNEKGHKARNNGERLVRQIAVIDAPRSVAALPAYFTGTATLGHMRRRWALTPAKDATRWSAETLSGWLRGAFTAARQFPRRVSSRPRIVSKRGLLPQQSHPSPFDGHTLCGGIGDEFHRTRSQVHRLRYASDAGSLDIVSAICARTLPREM